MDKSSRIYVAGHTGMVGSAIVRALKAQGYENVLTHPVRLDYQSETVDAFDEMMPEFVFMAAAKVGGIQANMATPADFIEQNLHIQTHVIESARAYEVKKLLFLGSSCMYPRDCPQPMREDMLLSGLPEPTNRAYAIAKIAGMEMCCAYAQQYGCKFFTVIPCNVYGPRDHYEPERAHVIPALIRKAAEGNMTAWGSGDARREFMHVDDLADACLFLMEHYEGNAINVGAGKDCSIRWLAQRIAMMSGRKDDFTFDESQPSGAAQKLLDVSRINALGWKAKIGLEEGLRRTIEEYKSRP